ncbi:MAG: hypothetical protein PHF84_08170 [bacterium]|nr:hypothetical protein [bacterium]
MKDNQYILFLFVLLALILLNAVIFYNILGLTFLLYAGAVVFTAGMVFLGYLYYRKNISPLSGYGKGPSSSQGPCPDASLLEKEVMIENLQSRTMQSLVQPGFVLHKRIIFIELLIIFTLLILLIIRRSL